MRNLSSRARKDVPDELHAEDHRRFMQLADRGDLIAAPAFAIERLRRDSCARKTQGDATTKPGLFGVSNGGGAPDTERQIP